MKKAPYISSINRLFAPARAVSTRAWLANGFGAVHRLVLFFVLVIAFQATAMAQLDNIWKGTTSTAWSTASNWSLNLVPTNAHNVRIPRAANLPTLSAASVARTITFIDSLTASATATLTVGAQTLTVGTTGFPGNITINNVGVLSISTGTVTLSIAGTMTLNTGGSISMTGAGTIAVSGGWTNNGGTMSNTAGTVSFTGAATQTIGGTSSTTFPAISIANTAVYQMSNDNSATSLTFVAGTTASSLTHTGTSTLTVNGNVTINQPTANTITKAWNINGGSATVSGTLTIGGISNTASRVAAVVVTTGSLSVTGTTTLSTGTSSAVARIAVGTGSVTFSSALNHNEGTLAFTGAGTMNFDNTYAFASGGSVAPILTTVSGANLNFANNVTVSATGGLTLNAGSNTTFTGASTITPTTNVSFGNVTVNTGVTVTTATAAGTLTIAGNLLVSGTGNLGGAGTEPVILSGASATIDGSGTIAAATTVSAAHSFLNTANLTLSGTWTINTGITVTNNGIVTSIAAGGIVGGAASATWTNAAGSTLKISGPLLATGTLTATGNPNTVEYTGAGQTVKLPSGAPATYHHLTLSGSGTVTMPVTAMTLNGNFTTTGTESATAGAALTINGDVSLGSGTTFNASTFTHIVGSNWTNNATTFTASTSTIVFTGSGVNIAGATTFNRVRVAGSGTKTFTVNHTINDSLNIVGGTLDVGSTTLVVGGNFNNGSTFTPSTSTVIFTGTGINASGVTTFNIVRIAGAGTKTFTANHTINDSLNIVAGTLSAGSTTLVVGGNFNNGATFTASTSTVVFTGSGVNVSGATTFNRVRVAGSGTKTFTVNHTINDSLNIVGGTLDVGGTTLVVGGNFNNASTFTPSTSTVIFTGSGINVSGATTFNRVRIASAGTKTFTANHTVNDSLNIVAGTLDGGSATLVVGGNFNNASTFTPSTSTVVLTGSGVNVSGATTFNRVRIAGSGTKTFTVNHTINDSLNIVAGTLDVGGTTLVVGGNFNNGGAFAGSTSTVIFTGSSINVSGATTFNIVRIAGAGTKTFTANHTINDSLNIVGGTLDGGSTTLVVGGNFNNGGAFTGSTGTVIFTGSGINVSGATTFNRVRIASVGTKTFTANHTINDSLNIVAGTLSIGSTSLAVKGNFNNDATFSTTTGTVTFSGTAAQDINGTSTTTFNNVTISNTSATASLSANVNISGTLTVNTNAVFQPAAAVVINNAAAQGTITGSGTIHVTRTAATPDYSSQYKFTTNTLSGLTVNYSGAGAQTVNALNYGSLTLSSSGTKTFAGATSIAGNFVVSGATADAKTNLTTITFNGTSAQQAAGITYCNLTINNTSGGVALSGSAAIDSVLTLTNGTFTVGANTLTFNGTPISGTATNLSANATSSIAFTGTTTGMFLPSSITALNNLTANVHPISNKITHNGALTISGILSLTDGIFDNMPVSPDTLTIENGASVSRVNGRLRGAMRRYIPTGAQTVVYDVGGNDLRTPVTLQFSNVTTAGYVTVRMLFGDHAQIATSGIDQNLSINRNYVIRPNGIAFGSGYNLTLGYGGITPDDMDPGATPANFIVRRYDGAIWSKTTVGTRTDTSTQATGLTQFGEFQVGEQLIKTWDGGALTNNWGDALNWNPDGVPTALEDVTLDGANAIDVNVAATTNTLTLTNPSLLLTILSGNSLTVSGDLLAQDGTLNTQGSFPSVTGTVSITGGTIGYTASSGSQTVVVQPYNNLTIGGGGTKTLAGIITLTGDLAISGGTFDLGSFTANRSAAGGTLTIANGATLKIGSTNTRPTNYNTHSIGATSTIEYSGSNQTIGALSSLQSYGHLILSGSGTKTFPSGTTGIAGDLTISGVTADATTNSSTIDFKGSASQAVVAMNYYNLTFSNAGTKTFALGTSRIANTFTIGGTASADATTNSTTIEYNGTSSQGVPAFTYNNLIVNNSAGVSLSGSTTVNGTLTLTSGNVTTSSNTLTIASTGSVSRTSGHIVGKLAKYVSGLVLNPTFEIGDASNYTPINITFASVSTAGYLTTSTTSGDHFQIITSGIDGSKSVNRYWTLTNSGIVFTTYDATFNFLAGDVDGGANTSNFIVGNYNGSTWTLPTVGTKTFTSTQATGLSGFNDFQIGEPSTGVTKTWDGGAGTSNWGDSQNWNPDGVPISTDNINLNGANTINVNVAAVGNSITLNNSGLTLTILSGNSLAVSSNLTLTSGTLNTQGAFPSVTGTVNITGGTVGYTGATGSQTVNALSYFNLTLSGAATKTIAAGTTSISGNFTVSGGSVDATTNNTTINFNGTGSQAVAAINYKNLTFSNTGTRTFASGTIGIAGDFIVTGGTTDATTNSTTVDFNGSGAQAVAAVNYYNLTMSNGGTKTLAAGTTGAAGNFTISGGTVNTTANSTTVNFNGIGLQAVPAISYYSLTMSNGGTKTFGSGTVGIARDFTVTGGTVDATTNSTTVNFNGTGAQAIAAINYHNLTVSVNGGTKTFASGTTGIASNFTVTAGAIDATSNSTTINFNGSGSQAVAAVNYHNLTFSNGGTKMFASGTTGITGNFTVSGGTANATTNATTIDFNGTGTQAVAAINYYNLTMSNGGVKTFASGTTTMSGNYIVSGATVNATANSTTIDFNALLGTQDVAAINYYNLTFSGGGTKRFASGTSKIASAFTISGGTADATTNTPTIEYNGSSSQTIRAITYNNLTINNSAGASLAGTITVNGTLNFISGNISTGANKVTVSSTGTVTRTSGHVIGNFEKYIPTIVPTRTFEIGDASGYTPVTVSFGSVSTPNYLTITTNAADHAQIGTSVIDSTKTANRTWTLTNAGVVFTNYNITLGFVSGDLDLGANTNNFIVGRYSGGSWSYPTVGTKTATSTQATGLTTFGDFQVGEQAGTTKTWVGLAGDLNWNNAINWSPATVPISTDNVNLNVDSTITVNTAAVSNSITLNSPNLVLFITTGNSLTASGTLTMLNGTLNTQASFPSVTGTVSLTGGTVEYSASGAQTISARTYNKLTLSGSGNKSAAGALTVNDSLQILGTAVFDAGTSLTHIFKGHWLVNSTAVSPFIYTTASTVNFNNPSPAGARNLDGTTSSTLAFNVVNVNNTSGFNVNLNISASGNLTVATNVTLTPGASNLISGTGTLIGNGTVKVTRTAATANFSSQYTITNKTLANLTVDYAASGQVLSNLTYGGLKVSGSITGALNSATVGNAFTVTGTFTPTSGTITMNNGSSIVNSAGTLTFSNLTIANAATSTTSSSFNVGGILSVGTGSTFTASSGTITMDNGSSIANSGTLTFNGLTVANTATVTTSSNFNVGGALSVGTTANFSPSAGTITMNNGSSIAN
ncbi:MAG: hypothetical protein HY088_00775, partial [Ignavibacteriales bacterium]|nr:hypothetical protein [Ignavibacteriales bacterium]